MIKLRIYRQKCDFTDKGFFARAPNLVGCKESAKQENCQTGVFSPRLGQLLRELLLWVMHYIQLFFVYLFGFYIVLNLSVTLLL